MSLRRSGRRSQCSDRARIGNVDRDFDLSGVKRAVFRYALGPSGLSSVTGTLVDTVAEHLFGFVAASIIATFTIVSLAASLSAMVLAGPRVYFAMARDGVFFEAMGRIHPRYRAPTVAIIAQAIWSGVLVLSGSLSQLVSYTGFAIVLFSGIAVSAVFVLRHRHPEQERPFRAWGYPWAPGLFIAASAAMVTERVVAESADVNGWCCADRGRNSAVLVEQLNDETATTTTEASFNSPV
jgi:amino acid transporter